MSQAVAEGMILLLSFPAEEKPSVRNARLRSARARLRQRMAAIDQIRQEIEELLATLPAPSPEAFERMVAGEIPVTPEALLVGALAAVIYHLDEASYEAEQYFRYTPSCLKQGLVDVRLLQHLGTVVKERAEEVLRLFAAGK